MIEGLVLLLMIVSFVGMICFCVFAVFNFIDNNTPFGFAFSVMSIICIISFVIVQKI